MAAEGDHDEGAVGAEGGGAADGEVAAGDFKQLGAGPQVPDVGQARGVGVIDVDRIVVRPVPFSRLDAGDDGAGEQSRTLGAEANEAHGEVVFQPGNWCARVGVPQTHGAV